MRNAKATLELERGQIRELNEAFKSAEDKTITVPQVGEVECPERRCLFPVRGTAERVEEGQAPVQASIQGTIVLWGDVTHRLIQMIDAAQYTAKEQKAKGYGGEVSCNKTKCTFAFALDANDMRADGRSVLEEAPRSPANVEEEAPPATK